MLIDADRGCVTGIIDGERAFYGDPLAEFASLTLLRDDDAVDRVMEGYGVQRGEPLDDPPRHLDQVHGRVERDLRVLARPR